MQVSIIREGMVFVKQNLFLETINAKRVGQRGHVGHELIKRSMP